MCCHVGLFAAGALMPVILIIRFPLGSERVCRYRQHDRIALGCGRGSLPSDCSHLHRIAAAFGRSQFICSLAIDQCPVFIPCIGIGHIIQHMGWSRRQFDTGANMNARFIRLQGNDRCIEFPNLVQGKRIRDGRPHVPWFPCPLVGILPTDPGVARDRRCCRNFIRCNRLIRQHIYILRLPGGGIGRGDLIEPHANQIDPLQRLPFKRQCRAGERSCKVRQLRLYTLCIGYDRPTLCTIYIRD